MVACWHLFTRSSREFSRRGSCRFSRPNFQTFLRLREERMRNETGCREYSLARSSLPGEFVCESSKAECVTGAVESYLNKVEVEILQSLKLICNLHHRGGLGKIKNQSFPLEERKKSGVKNSGSGWEKNSSLGSRFSPSQHKRRRARERASQGNLIRQLLITR